jgi:PAS domain S-box-containing protein
MAIVEPNRTALERSWPSHADSQANQRQDEDELRRIVDLIAQTIVVLNPAGKAIYANRVTLDYTGPSLDEVRADNFRDRVFHPEDIHKLRESRHEGLSGTVPGHRRRNSQHPGRRQENRLGRDGVGRTMVHIAGLRSCS